MPDTTPTPTPHPITGTPGSALTSGHQALLLPQHLDSGALEDAAAPQRLLHGPLGCRLGPHADEAPSLVPDGHAAALGEADRVVGTAPAGSQETALRTRRGMQHIMCRGPAWPAHGTCMDTWLLCG